MKKIDIFFEAKRQLKDKELNSGRRELLIQLWGYLTSGKWADNAEQYQQISSVLQYGTQACARAWGISVEEVKKRLSYANKRVCQITGETMINDILMGDDEALKRVSLRLSLLNNNMTAVDLFLPEAIPDIRQYSGELYELGNCKLEVAYLRKLMIPKFRSEKKRLSQDRLCYLIALINSREPLYAGKRIELLQNLFR